MLRFEYCTVIKGDKMGRGGKRANAGRPKGRGPHGEPTKPVRIPESLISQVQTFIQSKGYARPLFTSKVSAGFPSPADDFQEGSLDLNEHLVKHPAATFFVRVQGESMIKAGIFPDDILVVDRSLTATSGKIIIAILDGELTVKRFHQDQEQVTLLPENDDYPPIPIQENQDFEVWGVVTSVIHAV